jgi:hypothetical protein
LILDEFSHGLRGFNGFRSLKSTVQLFAMPLDPAIAGMIAIFRRSPNWDEELDVELLRKLWPLLAGEALGAATTITAIQGTTVVLNVPDRVWRRQLVRMKGQLLQKMNEPWGTRRITEIAFTYENQ